MLVAARFKYKTLINNQVHPGNENINNQFSVEMAEMKRSKKLSDLLAYMSIVYFIIGPFTSTLLTVSKALPSDFLFNVGSAVTPILLIQGTFLTTTLLFLKEFRNDYKTILPQKVLAWFSNENPPGQVHNASGPVTISDYLNNSCLRNKIIL